MAAAPGILIVLVVLLAIVGPLLLYALIQSERENQQTMDRETAEHRVRRDARPGNERATTDRSPQQHDERSTDGTDRFEQWDDDRFGKGEDESDDRFS